MEQQVRVRVTGSVAIEAPATLVRARDFPSRQALTAFVFLVLERLRPTSAHALADAIWGVDAHPEAWDSALSALLSKLRRLGLSAHGDFNISRRFGQIQLVLPPETWIDVEAAHNAVDEAEGHWRGQRIVEAYGAATVAACIAGEPLLPDVDGAWLERRRGALRAVLTRALRVLSDVSLANDEPELAVSYGERVVDVEPFEERHWGHLMRVHAKLGNRAEALRVYAACRERLREEIGTSPSPETEAIYLSILRA